MKCDNCKAKCCSNMYKICLTINDAIHIARHNDITLDEFITKYTFIDFEFDKIAMRYQGDYCVFLDQQTFMCTIYDIRPKMCRDYKCFRLEGLDGTSNQFSCDPTIG